MDALDSVKDSLFYLNLYNNSIEKLVKFQDISYLISLDLKNNTIHDDENSCYK